jgi:hypothetical protein
MEGTTGSDLRVLARQPQQRGRGSHGVARRLKYRRQLRKRQRVD